MLLGIQLLFMQLQKTLVLNTKVLELVEKNNFLIIN